ncbi:hypothetical protein PHYBOEH_001226 [Phytophthora boehmeriae]|uniref:Carbohydrate-binding protein n=1 Tax=Phytophthora boehmeriae TaxID=109152 RepID=A0A8T1WTJ5_9STRA|nr:hypothetical protein PHYBOEH_001226 [Phytophthora boehmeriae]
MRRRRRAALTISVLMAAIAHCAASEASRRLISFDEAHSIIADTQETAAEAVTSLVSTVTSSVLGGGTRTETDDTTTRSPATTRPVITITVGGSRVNGGDEIEKNAGSSRDDGEASEDETTAPVAAVNVNTQEPEDSSDRKTSAPTTVSTAVSVARRPTRTPAVSMTKIPTTSAPSSEADTGPSTGEGTGAESDAATPTVAPAPNTQAPTISAATLPPTTTVLTEAPTSEATQVPETGVTSATETPAGVYTPPTTTETGSGSSTDRSGVVDGILTDAPATTTSGSSNAVVIIPDEGTVMPLETTAAPAGNTGITGSSGASSPVATSDQGTGLPATWSPSSVSSGSNDTISPTDEREENSKGASPGQVHASSSVAESSDGSSNDASQRGSPKKKEKKTKRGDRSRSSSDDSMIADKSSEMSTTASSSDSGSSGLGSRGIGAILNPGGVSDVNTSSATYYSLGTGSIVAIVGVVAGILGILMLFVAIGRKKYTEDNDESPLPYGYDMDIRTVPRLSPTFMQEDSFLESGFDVNNSALMVPIAYSGQFDGTSSCGGESSDEVPSLRGNMMAAHAAPVTDISLRSRVPSVRSFSGDLDSSTLYSRSSLTSGSGVSGSWSSVLASDCERQPSRNTRDTTLSAWSAANLSSFGSSASGGSSAYRMTRSSTLSTDPRHTGGSDHQDRVRGLSASSLAAHQPNTNANVPSNRSNKSTEV